MNPEPLPPQPWRRSGKPPRRQLSTDLIVDAALELLQADGLDAVTMRKVAQRLDTGPASLYAHVQNKADLHELMLDRVLTAVHIPDPDPDQWQEQLLQVGRRMTAVLAAHTGIARIAMETLIPTTPTMLEQMDRLLAIMLAGGLSDADALAGSDILALFTAASAYEQSLRSGDSAEREAADRIDRITEYLSIVPAGRLPHLIALAPAMAESADSYELGFQLIIDGLAARAKR